MRKTIAIISIVLLLIIQIVLAITLLNADVSLARGILCITGHLMGYAILILLCIAFSKKQKSK